MATDDNNNSAEEEKVIDNNSLRQRFSPDGSPLRNHQLHLLNMLRELDRICKENNITYWLSSGNCIGAVRHGGFIPWDDDIDIEMMREDFLKLKELFKENDDYALQTADNDPYFCIPFGKFRDKHNELSEELNGREIGKNYKYKGVFIDILYIEPAPWFAVRSIDTLTYYLSVWGSMLDPHKKNRLFRFSKKLLFSSVDLIRKLFGKRSKKLFPTYGSGFHNARYKSDNLTDTIRVNYEGEAFPIPRNYDSYLRHIYGDYTSLPDLDKIKCHFPALKSTDTVKKEN